MKINIVGDKDNKDNKDNNKNTKKIEGVLLYYLDRHKVFIIIVAILSLTMFISDTTNDLRNEDVADLVNVNESVDAAIDAVDIIDGNEIPKEYQEALGRAKIYAVNMYMSKSGVYRQLISNDGENLSEESAGYAVKNLDVDWKENALAKGKEYYESKEISPDQIYKYLVSKDVDGFTYDEAQYAVDNLNTADEEVQDE